MRKKTEFARHWLGVYQHPAGDNCHSSVAPEHPQARGGGPGGAGAEDASPEDGSEGPKVTGDL